jgi:glycosyltransferase involved in cell wall biosynthesis
LRGTVFLSREASPWSTGGVEARLLREATRGVYDLDDALFEDQLGWRRLLGKRQKVEMAAACADVVIAGNSVLADFAAQHGRDVRLIPTCVQPGQYLPKASYDMTGPPTLVWLGSPSTEAYLTSIAPALREVHRRTGARVQVISAASDTDVPGLEGLMDRVTWTPTTYAAHLAEADVALAPLSDDPFARGKCAYKLLQYAATGLPVVGSPVGANQLALERFSGWSATTSDDWIDALGEAIDSPANLREARGRQGMSAVRTHYSFDAWADEWRAAVLT